MLFDLDLGGAFFFVLGGDGGGVGAIVGVSLFEVLLLLVKGFEKLNLDGVGVDDDDAAVDAGLLTGGLLLAVAVLPPLPKLNFIALVVDIVLWVGDASG